MGLKANSLWFVINLSLVLVIIFTYQNCSQGGFQSAEQTNSSVANEESLFTCYPNTDPPEVQLQHLTRREYLNTLEDLFGPDIDVSSLIPNELAGIPQEDYEMGFDRAVVSTTDSHVNAYFSVAESLATKIVNSDKLGTVVPSCVLEQVPTEECIGSFVSDFGLRVFRRPLKESEIDQLTGLYNTIALADTPRSGLRVLLVAFLNSPQFLYRVEDQGQLVQGRPDLLSLSPYEVASRLSYLILGSMPDAELFEAATKGQLNSDEGISEQLNRLILLPRAKATAQEFFEQWLRLKKAPPVNYPERYISSINDIQHLRSEMMSDLGSFVEHVIWDKNGDYQDLMTSNVAVVNDEDMASIYGVEVTGDQPVQLDPTQRAGLLTRPAFLHATTAATNPIHRGTTILRRVLCMNIPSPNPDIVPGALAPPPPDETKTTRQRFEDKTSLASCTGCHSTINPIGFAFEPFDSLGRFRTQEAIFNSNGELVNELDVDSSGYVSIDGEKLAVDGGVELARRVATSQQGPACFVKSYYEYSSGRTATNEDGCNLVRMDKGLRGSNGSILEMIKSMIKDPNFQLRKFTPQ